MNYADLLKEYIRKSGKTLDQISKECEELGVTIHPTYISKLRLGQRPAPSEEISKALAKVTGGDPDKLIYAALIEKSPRPLHFLLRDESVFEAFIELQKEYKKHDWDLSQEEKEKLPAYQKFKAAFEEFVEHDPEFKIRIATLDEDFLNLQEEIEKILVDQNVYNKTLLKAIYQAVQHFIKNKEEVMKISEKYREFVQMWDQLNEKERQHLYDLAKTFLELKKQKGKEE